MLLLIIFQIGTTAEAPQALEFRPALYSLIFSSGLAALVLLLLLSLLRNRARKPTTATAGGADLPDAVRQLLGSTSTNRGLKYLRIIYLLLACSVFGFHVYWAKYAEESNPRFQDLNYKDLRNRRMSDGFLRGWILDRSGKLENALAYYARDSERNISRTYPMDEAFAHLFGSDRGDPGLERALFAVDSKGAPEAWAVVMGQNFKLENGRDVRLTIDRDLQQTAVAQLKGRHGAVVVLNPQTGEVLALYSNPSYSLKSVKDETVWITLNADKRENPLVNRALGEYYVPGSTFKTVMMMTALRSGMQDLIFSGYPEGVVVAPGRKPIKDSNASCEVCRPMSMAEAYEASSNQYFAQMAVALGPDRIRETAKLLAIGAKDDPDDLLRGRRLPEIWNASSKAIQSALAPRESTMLTASKMDVFDIAQEGFGQGYAGQMTPLQMAMIAGTAANLNGNLMKPTIEYGRKPEAFNNVLSSQLAAIVRENMGRVTSGPAGTATRVMAPVHKAGIITGGKTGTAQKIVPFYDAKTGEPKTRIVEEKDPKGNIIARHEVVILDNDHPRVDSWFLCIAPLDRPQVAISVIVESGGYGARAAAPIAAALVLKARELGLLGLAAQAPGKHQRPTVRPQ